MIRNGSASRDLALAARLSDVASTGPAIGSVINVVAKEQQPYGLVCDLPEDDVFVGLVATAQAPPASVTTTPGSALRARVLDVQPLDGILDLTAKEVRTRFLLPRLLQLILRICDFARHAASRPRT